ncbi:hypothetical protein J31TS4_18450 [Paenibacillus sp. J31TS4]|uniref:YheC/YheD family protein n=1 Tax=Paenibacillus sp. J31TS4 TaxID=2807195 RepID=UPI001B1F5F22|nr:YheC/YheD family protein [Paenibacillus sp. J31TS4]GIP38565.1 hypothetical protein J31TS4_18450 [Paenibacillus sp. J31TS4]
MDRRDKSYTQRVKKKWDKTKALLKSRSMRRYVPRTKKLTSGRLYSMLRKYGMVYLKPNSGSSGKGVMRVERSIRNGKRVYQWRWEHHRREYGSFRELYRGLRRYTSRKPYLVQRGIHTLRHRGRVTDLRVMVQVSPRGRWETTGIIARIAHRSKVITNRSGGGSIMKAGQLFKQHMSKKSAYRLLGRLDRLGVRIARQLTKTYPGMKEIGADIALDRNRRPWILEVNSTPVVKLFGQLGDRSMYRKIVRYGRAYGRKF